MSEMNTNYNFANEKFTINPNVYFTVDTTVINGHRICKLKSLKIYYHEESIEMDLGTSIRRYIIDHGLQSIFSVELINYLNHLINHENLYEIYSEELKPNNLSSNSTVVGPHNRDNQQELSSFIFHDKSIEQVVNPLKNISNAISNIYIPDDETKIKLDLMIQKFNEKFEEINNKLDKNNEKLNNKIDQNNEKLNNKIDQNIQETKSIKRNIELLLNEYVSKNVFIHLFGNEIVEIFQNHKYRVINEGENKYMKYPILESKERVLKEVYLTARDLLHAKFRTRDGKYITPNQKLINKLKNIVNN